MRARSIPAIIFIALVLTGSAFAEGPVDFGDAPDPPYPTLQASGGASHVIVSGVTLGSLIDADANGQPEPAALGDDNNVIDDEDGIVFVSRLIQDNLARIDVNVVDTTGTALLQAWIDYDGSGTWDPLEAIAVDMPVTNGINKLYPTVPAWAIPGQTFARFRLSTASGLGPTGPAPDGEVEDYRVTVEQPACEWPTEDANRVTKWLQRPDESQNGLAVRFDVLADDFECNSPGCITEIHLWGSWLADQKGQITKLTVGIYERRLDPYRMIVLWEKDFLPGEFKEKLYAAPVPAQWWRDFTVSPSVSIPGSNTEIWQYDICIEPGKGFWQTGTPTAPIVYWLVVTAQIAAAPSGTPQFGWNAASDHDGGAAMYKYNTNTWYNVSYPSGHPYQYQQVDMAFVIGTSSCYTGPDHAQWLSVGKPCSWCNPRQCRGDANGQENGGLKLGYFWVQEADLTILINGWKKDAKYIRDYTPAIDPTGWIAADFSHSENGSIKLGYFRVQEKDLGILVNHWKKDRPQSGDDPAVPADCLQ